MGDGELALHFDLESLLCASGGGCAIIQTNFISQTTHTTQGGGVSKTMAIDNGKPKRARRLHLQGALHRGPLGHCAWEQKIRSSALACIVHNTPHARTLTRAHARSEAGQLRRRGPVKLGALVPHLCQLQPVLPPFCCVGRRATRGAELTSRVGKARQ
jgi:hypothetical protein